MVVVITNDIDKNVLGFSELDNFIDDNRETKMFIDKNLLRYMLLCFMSG